MDWTGGETIIFIKVKVCLTQCTRGRVAILAVGWTGKTTISIGFKKNGALGAGSRIRKPAKTRTRKATITAKIKTNITLSTYARVACSTSKRAWLATTPT